MQNTILYKALFIDDTETNEIYEPATIQEAYMAVFYSILISDGQWTDKELKALKPIILSLRDFEDEDDIYYLQKIKKLTETYTLKSILTAGLNFIDASKRPQLFCFCVELVVADNKIAEEEKKILNYLADHSQLSPVIANKIIEVTLIRKGK